MISLQRTVAALDGESVEPCEMALDLPDEASLPEALAAAAALLQEIREDVCTLDQTIPFFESELGAQIFGAERAEAMAAHAREIKEQGAKWCDCPACAAGVKILENASALV